MQKNWIEEKKAAEILGLKPRTLRKKVLGTIRPGIEITFTNINGRNYKYLESDIEKLLQRNSIKATA